MNFLFKKNTSSVYIYIALAYFTCCCNLLERKNERALAKAYKETLHPSDVTTLIPFGTSAEDSARMANKIITDWVRTRAILHQAKKYLEIDQKEIEKKALDYKNELIVYAYEKQLISEKLDTAVSIQEIKNFYEKNKPNFNSNTHLVKAIYAVIPNNKPKLVKDIGHLISLKDVKSIEALTKLCEENKISYDTGNEWIEVAYLKKNIPFSLDNANALIDANTTHQYQQSGNTFFLNILDYHSKDEESLWEYEEKKIRLIIINKRKRELLQNIRKEIYNAARDRKEIEVFESK